MSEECHKRKFTPSSEVADACVAEPGRNVDKRIGNCVMALFRAPVAYSSGSGGA